MDGSIPLSFPAILRNQAGGLHSRFAHLVDGAIPNPQHSKPRSSRKERRQDNAKFTGNVHIIQPTRLDLLVPTPQVKPTFPAPLPPYLARDNRVPNAVLPERDASADSGRYSLSLKGMRRSLRGMGFRSRHLVREIEAEILGWLSTGGTILFTGDADPLQSGGKQVGDTSIVELSRTPLQLVWKASDDPFMRYVVHCTARYHKVVSYSKEINGERITYLLRPNVTLPSYNATAGLETPPATDLDLSSQLDSESDLASDRDARSDIGGDGVEHMSTIREDSAPPTDDEWSVVGDDEKELAQSLDPDATLVVERRFAAISLRSRAGLPHTRSTSSPSRSPARPQRRFGRRSTPVKYSPPSFYDFLFT